MRDADQNWSVYLVRCKDDTLYCGISTDVVRRVGQHDAGRGARYTRGRGPVELLTSVGGLSKRVALALEAEVKRLPRDQKEEYLTWWEE